MPLENPYRLRLTGVLIRRLLKSHRLSEAVSVVKEMIGSVAAEMFARFAGPTLLTLSRRDAYLPR